MNGANGLSAAEGANAAGAAEEGEFSEAFDAGVVNTAAAFLQLIGADIIESVMKDETAVD